MIPKFSTEFTLLRGRSCVGGPIDDRLCAMDYIGSLEREARKKRWLRWSFACGGPRIVSASSIVNHPPVFEILRRIFFFIFTEYRRSSMATSSRAGGLQHGSPTIVPNGFHRTWPSQGLTVMADFQSSQSRHNDRSMFDERGETPTIMERFGWFFLIRELWHIIDRFSANVLTIWFNFSQKLPCYLNVSFASFGFYEDAILLL